MKDFAPRRPFLYAFPVTVCTLGFIQWVYSILDDVAMDLVLLVNSGILFFMFLGLYKSAKLEQKWRVKAARDALIWGNGHEL